MLTLGGSQVAYSASGWKGVAAASARNVDSYASVSANGTTKADPTEVRFKVAHSNDERIELTRVSVGNPHAVVRRDPDRGELLRLGPLLERHERFPERTNVQLVRVDGPHDVTALVWERGAGETSASGSSAVAVAAAAIADGWCESPVTIHMPGGTLGVILDGAKSATLTGRVEPICRGETAE